ncbi:MAG: UDP-N-acetylmuramoyl-L-alanine--D-glutamate ligase [Cyanobacteria bacterium SZAS LIN-5]|nr:UDP-N-acetylmuramoyl-L-alanine--D-glutamate ligase [Cyanobacteria bacterium SZAS LIN-5]RTL39828.1 MAG: UDP-N-acetylmuramoyl-L-alanine--D-glutamate ligase [Candidatus Melainabacteria bacterium]
MQESSQEIVGIGTVGCYDTAVADWDKRKISIMGLGRSGIATAKYLASFGANVLLSEAEETPDKLQKAKSLRALGVRVEFGPPTDEIAKFGEFIVTSPGIKPDHPVFQTARQLGKEVISDVELAYRETRVPIIAVTGTNGKSTTTALISYILEKSGRVAPACGNIGVPVLDQLERRPDYLVIEVSSYQLHYCKNFAPYIGVWLNLTPDHLDWHGSLDEYVKDKRKLFTNQRADQYSVLNMDDSIVAATPGRSEIFPFSPTTELDAAVQGAFMKDGYLAYRIGGRTRLVCHQSELQILGQHNLENALAAISVCAIIGVEPAEIEMYLKDFGGLEHRLEYVATISGVKYYNDSKATNTDSAIKALQSFPDDKVVLIAGGKDKGTALGDFVHSVKTHAGAVILIGEAKERFENALKEGGVENIYPVDSLEEAVDLGGKLNLGPVLLSPACASFDMFKDFEDRGRVFKDIVRARLEKVAPSK